MHTRVLLLLLALLLLLSAGTVAAAPLAGEPQHVIIIMKDQPARAMGSAELMAFSETSQRDLLFSVDRMSADKPRSLWSVNAIAATLTEEQVKQVAARPDVERVIPDYIITIDLLKDPEVLEKGDRGMRFFRSEPDKQVEWIAPPYPYEDDVAWSVSWIEAPEVWANGFDGTGVTVAVIDTGIDPDHPDLHGKVVGWADLVNNRDVPYDDNGHGTHCAGTVAGTGAGGLFTGVAPGANLIGVKAFDQTGIGNLSQVLGGFEAAVQLGADVISYSAGYSRWKPPYVRENVIETQEGVTYEFPVLHYNDVYDPSFTLLWVNAAPFSNISITMKQPDGTVFPGVDCDWYQYPLDDDWKMLKFMGNDRLQAGNWTMNLAVPGYNESKMVWYSGKGDHIDNKLNRTFNLTDQIGSLDTLTFEMHTWYDIEYYYDNGYIEVYDTRTQQWTPILTLTGTGSGTYSIDLMPFIQSQTPLPPPIGPNGPDQIPQENSNLTILDLRLRYNTDPLFNYAGWYVDWMAIPEIGFYDDASGDAGWTVDPDDGWDRVQEQHPFYARWVVFYTDNGTSIQSRAVNQIVENGTVFVTSAGNDGEFGLRTIGGPAADKAIIVGATGHEQDYIAPYSSRGPSGWDQNLQVKPDVVAPGSWVLSTVPGGCYGYMSGTSMACPHVSGIAALMLQANETLSPGEIKTILQETAVDLGPEGPDYDYGHGRVSAWAAMEAVTPLVPPAYDAPRLHAGYGFGYLKMGEENVITAISWNGTNGTPIADVPIRFIVYQGQLEFINQTVLTNPSGMATASFEVNRTGYHDYRVEDSFGNAVSGSINVYTPSTPRAPLLFDTPFTSYYALPNSTVPVKYTLVDPLTMAPYDGDVRMVINYTYPQIGELFNGILTPDNGTIEAEVNLTGKTFSEGRIFLAPVANLTHQRNYGYLYIQQWDGINEQVSPFVTWAARKGNATLLVKQYTAIESKPAPDGIYELPVIWLYEVDVKALSARFPAETARLLAGDIQERRPEYSDFFGEIENMQIDIRYIPYELKNGIGKLTVPVPDGAYIGYILSDHCRESGDQAQSELSEIQAIILVDLWPFMYTPSAPAAEPDRWLSIWGEWAGEYSAEARSIAPGTEVNVTCYLRNPETGEPMEGTVYLYTSDQSAVVQTNAAGYGSAILPVAVRYSDSRSANAVQVVGLSGDAYASAHVYPPNQYFTMTADYVGDGTSGVLHGAVSITTPDGIPILMPGIFDVQRSDIVESFMSFQWRLKPSASIFSTHIEGSGSYAGEQPYGSYLLKTAVKDWFMRGQYSQGNWLVYSTYVGATPLEIINLPPLYAEPGPVDVTVRMPGNQAGVPVYLTYDTVGPYSHFYGQSLGSVTDQYGGADIQTTGSDGRATLRMNVPENSWLWWEIGGGTPDRVFTTRSGYTIQDTPPEPVAPTANFIGSPLVGPAPLEVRFTDTSTGIPTSWQWNFGDGTQSTERHPTKIYQTHGVYTVSLTATNAQGSNTTTKAGYITVLEPTTIMAGTPVIPTGMNRTTGVSVANMQNMTAVGVELAFNTTLAEVTRVQVNASVAEKLYQVTYTLDNTTGRVNVSMTLNPGIDAGAAPVQVLDLTTVAKQTIGSWPVAIVSSEFSVGTGGDAHEFAIIKDGSIRVRKRGDFNDNGRIDIGDVARVAYMAVGLTPADPEADFGGTGAVDGNDAAKIAYFYVGKIHEL